MPTERRFQISELLDGIPSKDEVRNINKTIFLASSEELKDDRKEFEIFINRENKEFIKKGIFLKFRTPDMPPANQAFAES